MATERQIRANRKNAKHSTGPRTDQGKTRASKNAMRTGILSRDLIAHGESREEFDAILSQLVAEFRPQGLSEAVLVERVAIAMWRQKRLVRVESAQISHQLLKAQVVDTAMLKDVAPQISEAELETLSFERILVSEDDFRRLGAAVVEVATLLPKESPHSWAAMESEVPNVFALFLSLAKQLGREPAQWFKQLSAPDGHFYNLMVRVIRLRGVQEALQKHLDIVKTAQGLPLEPERWARYQTALDNELYKALGALRHQQAHRMATLEWVADQNMASAP